MNPIHRGQGLASPNEAWQTWRQETQGSMCLSDSFSSSFYCCWMFISDLGGSIVAPLHFLACITHSVQSPTNSLSLHKNVSRGTIQTWIFFPSPHILCLFTLLPHWILWLDLYTIRKHSSIMLYLPLSSHVRLVLYNPLCLGKHYFCSALPGEAPCADRQPFCSHPTKLPCILHRKTLISWNNAIDKACLLFHFPKDIFCFSGEKGGVSLEPSKHSEQTGSLQAQGCYACFTAFFLLTVVFSNAK